MAYRLQVRENLLGGGKYIYEIVDSEGEVLKRRISNRVFVAATIDAEFFFRSLDLIGEGDHGRDVQQCKNQGIKPPPIAYI